MTIPNLLTMSRIIGSPVLVLLGVWQLPLALAILAVLLIVTEWLDGYLARKLKVESAIGARLDTVADALFYSSLLLAVACLVPQRLVREWIWFSLAIGSYLGSWFFSWTKFGCLPSYHTWMAKLAWCLVAPGIMLMVLGWDVWLFRFSMVFVLVTNLEAILITRQLKEVEVDVPSIWHARQERDGHDPE